MTDVTQDLAGKSRLSPCQARYRWLIVVAALAALAAYVTSIYTLSLLFTAFTVTTLLTFVLLTVVRTVERFLSKQLLSIVMDFMRHDPTIGVITDLDGTIVATNTAGRDSLAGAEGQSLSSSLRFRIADPSTVLFRLRDKLRQSRSTCREEVVLSGKPGRIIARPIGAQHILWRIVANGERSVPGEFDTPLLKIGRYGNVLYMNVAAKKLSSYPIRTLDDLVTDRPMLNGALCRIQTVDGPLSYRVVRLDQGVNQQEVLLIPSGEMVLESDETHVRFDALPLPMLRLSLDGTIRSLNNEARKLLQSQHPEGDKLPHHFQSHSHTLTRLISEVSASPKGAKTDFLQLQIDGKDVYVQVTLLRVTGECGNEILAVLTDATELKTLEAQFVQNQKMQAIGQLAGGVAHDFNNLLTAISGHCDLLLLRHDRGDPDYADLIQINHNSNRAAALVGQLLAFSRKQNLQPQLLDMRNILADLTHLLNRLVGERVVLKVKHGPGLPKIHADKRQLEQVIMNLVVNGRDAMPEGGTITIKTRSLCLETPWNRDNSVVPPGTYVQVTVTDEGTGIPPEVMDKVFEPFFSTKPTGEGTGLGLSTVYGIIRQSGSFIFVDSPPGCGTTFTLLFPGNDAEPTISALPAKPEPVQRDTALQGVILLVEDEAPVRTFASRALRLRGHTVIEAESGEQALEALRDPSLEVDVVVSDVIMPGIDGPSWVRKAMETHPDLRVVFVSGYAEDAFETNETAMPHAVFLPKPFSLTELTETVQEQMV